MKKKNTENKKVFDEVKVYIGIKKIILSYDMFVVYSHGKKS